MRRMLRVVSVGIMACSTTPELGVRNLPADQPIAIIGTDSAVFGFPRQPTAASADGLPCSSDSHIAWDVLWRPAPARLGIDPDQLVLGVVCERDAPRGRTLTDLMAVFAPAVLTCNPGSEPSESSVTQDPDVTAGVIGGRVMFRVSGRAAVRRVFPVRPDSVEFVLLSGLRRVGIRVPVTVR